jgi:peptide/nickel transport system permease protein
MTRRAPLARVVGGSIVVIIILASLAAPLISSLDPNASGDDLLTGASALHWFGTDDLGRDVFTRVLYGGRVSLVLGLGAAVFACLIGVPIGMAAGFARGWIGLALVQLIDLFIALPGLVLALVITVMVGATMGNLVLVLGMVQWPTIARLVRGQVLALREMLFVEAARAMGGSSLRILVRHIWPNIARVVAAQFAIAISAAIFTSASLSFLGLGLPPPTPDWGGMVQAGFEYLSVNPWLSLGPGAVVTLTIFGFYMMGRTVE